MPKKPAKKENKKNKSEITVKVLDTKNKLAGKSTKEINNKNKKKVEYEKKLVGGDDDESDDGLSSEEENEEDVENNMDEVEDEDKLDDENTVESDTESEEEDEGESVDGDEDGDDCVYKLTKKKNDDDIDDKLEEDNFAEDEDVKLRKGVVPKEDRQTKPIMTKYERVRILGERARQLSLGAKPMIKGMESKDPKEVARQELKEGSIPLLIERELPNGMKEIWEPKELKIPKN